jgi:putative PEP-CTERM system histidine kinase
MVSPGSPRRREAGIRGCRAFVVIVALALAVGCARSSDEQRARALERGDRHFAGEQYREAIVEYREALRHDPANPRAIRQLGLAYLQMGDLAVASPFLLRAEEQAPDDLEVRQRLGQLYLAGRKPDEATAEARYILARDPRNVEGVLLLASATDSPGEIDEALERLRAQQGELGATPRYQLVLGILHWRRGDAVAAERAFTAAVARDPKSVEARLALARFLTARGDRSGAERELKAAIDLAPVGSPARMGLAGFYVAARRRDEARQVLREITEQTPDFLPAWRRLAGLSLAEHDDAETERALEGLFKRSPQDIEGRLIKGRLLLARGDTAGAIQVFEDVLKVEPNLAVARYHLAIAQLKAGQVERARSALQQAVTSAPTYTEAVLLLAQLEIQAGRARLAVESLERLAAARPTAVPVWVALGTAHLGNRQPDHAAEAFRKITELAPRDPRGLQLLGVALRAQGKGVEATRQLEAALALVPTAIEPLSQLVAWDLTEKKPDAALARVKRQLAQVPRSALHQELLGRVHLARGEPEPAEAALQRAIELEPRLASAYVTLGRVYASTGKDDEALRRLEGALAINPRSVGALMLIGTLSERRGDLPRAREAYARALEVSPRFAPAANNLAVLLSQHGDAKDRARAFELAQMARDVAPDDPRIADTLGWILYQRGAYQPALALLQESAQKLPDEPQIQYHLGEARKALTEPRPSGGVRIGSLLPAAAGLACVALAAAVLFRRPLGRLQWSFALGMLAFGAQSVTAWGLLAGPEVAGDTLTWLQLHAIAALVAPLPWGVFVAALTHREAPVPIAWRASLVAATGLVVAAAIVLARSSVFVVPVAMAPTPFEVAGVQRLGAYLAVLEILLVVAILAGLEAALRSAGVVARGRIKFLALGLGAIFLVRFYLASQVVAFRVITGDSLKIGATILLVATAVMAVGVARERLRDIELTISRALLYRSVVVSVLGVYLLAVGVLGWLLNYLQIPEKAFWGSLVIFVSALFLALLMLSDRVRWRVKRFVALNLYRSKYDYREQWGAFTRRMASLVTVDEIGPQLLEVVTEAVGTAWASLYVADGSGGLYTPVASIGLRTSLGGMAADTPLVARLRDAPGPIVLDGSADPELPPELAGMFGGGSVALPLVWRGALTGFILIGPERTGMPYGPEDLLFMATIGEQAAGSIATSHMSEALARTREFDAFNRLTSYVIHDVKNSVSALSLLARNALTYFDDPEFQRDSIRTLSRTVDRMKGLLARLGTPGQAVELAFEPVALAALLEEAVRPLRADTRLTVVTDFRPVPQVSGDPEALMQALQNLVTNAAEAIAGPGTVTVSVDSVDGAVVVSVADTGPGMSDDFVRRALFTPFRSTKEGGWGLGLFQTRDIIERHGGTIAVTSVPGQGTTFRVRLPVIGAPAARVGSGARQEDEA